MSRASLSDRRTSEKEETRSIQRRVDELIEAARVDHRHSVEILEAALARLRRDGKRSVAAATPRRECAGIPHGAASRLICGGVPFAVMVMDGDRRIRQVNRAIEEQAAPFAGELLGARVGEAFGCLHAIADPRGCGFGSGCDHCVLSRVVSDTVVNRRSHRKVKTTLPLVRPGKPEGSRFLLSSTPVELAGEAVALICLEDSVEGRWAEETLRAIADYTYDWESWLAPDGRLMWVNPAVEKLTGYSPADCHEMSDYPMPIVHAEDRERFRHRLRGALVRLGSVNDVVFRISCKDGSARWMAISWQPIFNEHGRHIGLRASVRDITERKQAEEERQQLAAQLNHSQKMEAIGQLAGGVAHDFNNLLTVIRGNAEMIEAVVAPGTPAARALDAIQEAARHAVDVTCSLLTFSRKAPAEKERIELRSLVDKTTRLLQHVIPASISIKTDRREKSPVWVFADGTQLQQVMMNLAINARDAMPNGGELHLHLKVLSGAAAAAWRRRSPVDVPAGRCVQLIVRDTGVGMSAETRDRAFEPFFTTKEREQGTGLGLAIAHGIVREHGGHIGIDSAPEKGTTFTITLPEATFECAGAAANDAAGRDGPPGKLVLLGEPDWNARSIVGTALRNCGFQVVEAANGEALAEHLTAHRHDVCLLVLSIELPMQSRSECLQEIRSKEFGTPVIVIAGETDPVAGGQWGQHVTLLHKPFSMSELRRCANELVAPRDCREAVS